MPAAARLGDKAQVDADAHGCPACPHPGVGPIVTASTDVFVNDKGAVKFAPVMMTVVPPAVGPMKGAMPVIVGGRFATLIVESTELEAPSLSDTVSAIR